MSDTLPASTQMLPEDSGLTFQAMQDIGRAATPEEIVTALRHHVVKEADCVVLIQTRTEGESKPTTRVTCGWDRDDPARAERFPDEVRALLDDQPLVVADTAALDEALAPLKTYANTLRAASLIIVPLHGRKGVTGYLVSATRQLYPYGERQARILLMLGWTVGALLDNQVLAESLSRQAARAGVIGELAEALSGVSELELLAEGVASTLSRALPVAHLSLALGGRDQPEVDLVVMRGTQMPDRVLLGGSRFEHAISQGKAVLLNDLAGWPDSTLWQSAGVHRLIVAPMIVHGQVLGNLNAGAGPSQTFSQDDVLLCEQAAAQVAAALHNIRQFEHLQASLKETTSLYGTALAVNAAQNLEEIYTTTLGEIAQVSQADRVTLHLAGPDPRTSVEYIELRAVWEQDRLFVQGSPMRYPMDQAPVLSHFPHSRSNMIFNEVKNDTRLSSDLRTNYAAAGVTALMLIPLSTGATWLGALLLEAQQGQTFSNDQARLSRSLADQAALAIDLQLLLARTRQVVGYERALLDITDRIRRATTVDEISQIASEELSRVLEMPPDRLTNMELDDTARSSLTREQVELIESVETQVALAIENLNLLESTKQATGRAQVVGQMTAQLQRAADVSDAMEMAVSTLAAALDEYDVRIRLTSPEGQPIPPPAGAALPDESGDEERHP